MLIRSLRAESGTAKKATDVRAASLFRSQIPARTAWQSVVGKRREDV
jgi:hypothetical protein